MLKDRTLESIMNATDSRNIASDYVSIQDVFGSYFLENPYFDVKQPDEVMRKANASQSITYFLQVLKLDPKFETVVGHALGVFDGQIYLWLVTKDLDTQLTRELFALKSAIEQRLHSEFDIHVEPLGNRNVRELIPSGFVAV